MKGWMRRLAVIGLLVGMVATAMPVGADDPTGYFRTYTTTPQPAQWTNAVIWVELSDDPDGYAPQIGVPVHTVWHYRTSTPTVDWYTDANGTAAMIRNIGPATCGYTVRVDIYVGYEQTQIDSAYFTPCYG